MVANKLPPSAPSQARNQRILIIDDNTSIHDDVRKILGVAEAADAALDDEAAMLFGLEVEEKSEKVVFEIDSAFQGQEGLGMVRRALEDGRPYAMAFVDVRMPPGWDGIETIGRIWKQYPELQVVICTAYSDYSWETMFRQVGKTDNLVILKKPFDNIEVLQLAHTLTQKWTVNHCLQNHLVSLDRIVAERTAELVSTNSRLRQEMEERELAQRELANSEERFAKAFLASPIPMSIRSLKTEQYLDVNDAFLEMTGHTRAQVAGHTAVEIKLWAEPAEEEKLIAQLRKEGSARHFEAELRARDGTPRFCQIYGETFHFEAEEVALLAAVDVSEQRKLEQQLRQAQKLEAVGQLAAGVAHDFNNILTVIQGHVSMQLQAHALEKSLSSSLRQVSDAAERAAALTRQLLAFSRKQVVQRKAVNLNRVVANLEEMLRRLIGSHIDLQCDYAAKLPEICADEANVEQILVNVVVNARDAMAHGGVLRLSTSCERVDPEQLALHPSARDGEFVKLTVSDTGCGMDEETLDHIFEPFFTTKEVGKGTGLGLATVYGIVAQHDGWVEASSKVGVGTTFRIFLPATDLVSETPAPAGAAGELRGGQETIMLVEDEPDVREVVADILLHHGYRVLTGGDGPEALEVWAEHKDEVDLLITDIMMPNGMKGNVLAEKLRADKPHLKVIFSSGYSPDFANEASPLAKDAVFLQKPYKLQGLVSVVRECLDSR